MLMKGDKVKHSGLGDIVCTFQEHVDTNKCSISLPTGEAIIVAARHISPVGHEMTLRLTVRLTTQYKRETILGVLQDKLTTYLQAQGAQDVSVRINPEP